MILKFDLKKLGKLAAISAASLALVVPLSMNSGTVANAAEGPYYYDDGELVYNGFTNEDGYWIGSKRDKWLFDHGCLEPDGDDSDKYDTAKNYSKTRHISLIRALKLYDIMNKMPDKEMEKAAKGKPIESEEAAMDVTEAIIHHKYPNLANKRHGKRTSRKSRKKNVRRPKARRDKRTAAKKQAKRAKRSRKRGKRTIKARRTRKAQKKHKTRRIRR